MYTASVFAGLFFHKSLHTILARSLFAGTMFETIIAHFLSPSLYHWPLLKILVIVRVETVDTLCHCPLLRRVFFACRNTDTISHQKRKEKILPSIADVRF
jgi:hypothetical protein